MLTDFSARLSNTVTELTLKPQTVDDLATQLERLEAAKGLVADMDSHVQPIQARFETLARFEHMVPQQIQEELANLPVQVTSTVSTVDEAGRFLADQKIKYREIVGRKQSSFVLSARTFREEFSSDAPFGSDLTAHSALEQIAMLKERLASLRGDYSGIHDNLTVFGVEMPVSRDLGAVEEQLQLLETLWMLRSDWDTLVTKWQGTSWEALDSTALDESAGQFYIKLRKSGQNAKSWAVYQKLEAEIKQFRQTMPLIAALRQPALRDRHFQQLSAEVGQVVDPFKPEFTLATVYELGLDEHAEVIMTLSESAEQELGIENSLTSIKEGWQVLELDIRAYSKTKGFYLLHGAEEVFELLEDNTLTLSTMKGSRFVAAFESQLEQWEKTLGAVADTIELILSTQRSWMYLEAIFMGSEDIRRQLPSETAMFLEVNTAWGETMTEMHRKKLALSCLTKPVATKLQNMVTTLEQIQRQLDNYLEVKRQAFPRFYFLSNDELLEILGQARNPEAVQPHMKKCFDAVKMLDLQASPSRNARNTTVLQATALIAGDGEKVMFQQPVTCSGAVEGWLLLIESAMRKTLAVLLGQSLHELRSRAGYERWIAKWPGQLTLTAGLIQWTDMCQQ
ncbi:dynein heavy chain, partial [Kipferlia bialata]|eukprot:g5699.t1